MNSFSFNFTRLRYTLRI